MPGVKTSLGVSNVSFGVSPGARAVLNSVFLHHCVEAGLDLAMVNPNHITPYGEIVEEERELADDLVFNRRDDALERFIAHFESKGSEAEEEVGDPTAEMEPEEALHWRILRRKKDGVEGDIDRAVEKIGAVPTLNDVLLPAMKEVGDKFGAGELILPFVLQSAEVMKRAVAQLENYLDKIEGYTKGTVVLATVFGDVHDIGKSLVNTILTNNGYTVIDLGKQVPIQTILDAAEEHEATAIGLSALLVSTSKQMPLCVQELHNSGLRVPAADRRRGDQPQLLLPHALPRRQGVRRRLRARRLLLQGRIRGPGRHGPARRRRGARGAASKVLDGARRFREKGEEPEELEPPTPPCGRRCAPTCRSRPAVLGRAGDPGRHGRALLAPRHPRAVQAPLGRARREGRGVEGARRDRLPAAAGAHVEGTGPTCTRARWSGSSPATPRATTSSCSTPSTARPS